MRQIVIGVMLAMFSVMPIVGMAQALSDEPYRPPQGIPFSEVDDDYYIGSAENKSSEQGSAENKGELKKLNNVIKSDSLIKLVHEIIKVVRVFAIPIVVLFIIYGGFLLATAGGSPDKIKNGKNTITWALVGGVIVIGAELILGVISSTLSAI